MQTPRTREQRHPTRPTRGTPAEEEREPAAFPDPVDEASAESMIASDPPARSGLRLGPARKPRRRP